MRRSHRDDSAKSGGATNVLNCHLFISGAATVERTVLDWIAEIFGFDKTRYYMTV